MKIKVLALSAVAAFMVACGGGSTPEDVAKNFHEAIVAQEWDKASDLATAKGKEQVKSAKDMAESMGALGGEKPTKPEVEKVTCETKEAESNCTCTEKGGKETKYTLKKEGDKWLVDYNKLGNMGGDVPVEEPTEEPAVEEVVSDSAAVEVVE